MFKQNLRNLRRQQNLTQRLLAQKLDVATSTIGAWESGRNQPSIEDIKRLAELFNVTTDYLLSFKSPVSNSNDLNHVLDGTKEFTFKNKLLTQQEKNQLKVALTQIFWNK